MAAGQTPGDPNIAIFRTRRVVAYQPETVFEAFRSA
jgi:hypothetical protein